MIQNKTGKAFGWFVRKIGALTLLSLALLLLLFGILIYGLIDTVRGIDFVLLFPIALLGLLFGWWLGRINISKRATLSLAVILGFGIVLFRVGRLGGQIIIFLEALTHLQVQYQPWQIEWGPVWTALTHISASITTLIARASTWIWRIINGQQAFDPIAIALVWSLLMWGLAVWAGWSVRRWRRPLLAIVPAVALLAGILNYVNGNASILLPLIGGTLLLIALIRYSDRETSWQARGIDYSEDLRPDYFLVCSVLSIIVVGTAALAPSVSVRKITNFARGLVQSPPGETSPLAESLGLQAREDQDDNFYALYAAGLPRSHLLGSGPELSEQIVMLVETDAQPPSDPEALQAQSIRYYWRSLTFDRYLGSGWATRKTKAIDYPANQAILSSESLDHIATQPSERFVQQSIKGVEDLGGLLYNTGRLITTDQNFQVAWRLPPIDQVPAEQMHSTDMFGALIDANAYQAISVLPNAGVKQLRAAGDEYPSWVSEKYLSLPDTVPERVVSLALGLTATEPTPYDRAKAIESYLRGFPYTLNISAPPPGRDVVDYFLFDLKRGYCDYYASAMVVLARAAGLPARLVIGYASGTYDATNDQYTVTAADAHSWPEIYFPNIGWVEFEPTAGRPPLERPEDTPPGEVQEWTSGLQTSAETSRKNILTVLITFTGGIFASILFALVAWMLTDRWRLQRLEPATTVSSLFRRLYLTGRKLTLPATQGDTPYEFATSLKDNVASVAKENRWEDSLSPALQEIHQLTDLYTQAIYSPHPPVENDRNQAIQTWGRLRYRLLLARLLGKFKSSTDTYPNEQNKQVE